MRVELFPFQQNALNSLRMNLDTAFENYKKTNSPQVISFSAPTGSGKTIIMASLFESVFFGDDNFPEQPENIILWLSDSPQLNEQSKLKINTKSDLIRLSQTVSVSDDSFDQEMFEDGHVYFLNTQKLSKAANLTKEGDRNYTIWETIANTVRNKGDRFIVIIDEAHRGMKEREAKRAMTIMQKFIKGSKEDKIPPMPVVIGMSATPERFNDLVSGTTSTVHKTIVSPDEVRESGLLKDRIVLTYPEEKTSNKDMAVLQAAADDFKEKWEHWYQFCKESHYSQVVPIFIIQVLNGNDKRISFTDLDDCLKKIEDRTGFRFAPGQVVHTFGNTNSPLVINGLEVPYVEPSRINDDRKIRVVFFKESLSTGWDCPRAETMMSFKHAEDATYIAQLLGRMVRTPMQRHISLDDVLNDVHLFLPYFNGETVDEIINALQNSESGDIPADIEDEILGENKYETYTIRKTNNYQDNPAIIEPSFFGTEEDNSLEKDEPKENCLSESENSSSRSEDLKKESELKQNINLPSETSSEEKIREVTDFEDLSAPPSEIKPILTERKPPIKKESDKLEITDGDLFDREEVVEFINLSGLLSYNIRTAKVDKYPLKSLFRLAHLLVVSGADTEIINKVSLEIADKINVHIKKLKDCGEYESLVDKVKQFKLSTQILDVFGETVNDHSVQNFYTTTDTDIDRQFKSASTKLGGLEVGHTYARNYKPEDDSSYKIDVIIYAVNTECINDLQIYAHKKFNELNDTYRFHFATVDEKTRNKFNKIISDSDKITKHSFRLPETFQKTKENGKEYTDHLFVSEETGTAQFKLNSWEEGVIAEEEERNDFICWIRNPVNKPWSLCLPYVLGDTTKSFYPDFLIVRKGLNPNDQKLKYVVDILEPHRANENDNLAKAKALADYAKDNLSLGRIQLIREGKDSSGKKSFKRLDFTKSEIREAVKRANTNEDLNKIFSEYGKFEI